MNGTLGEAIAARVLALVPERPAAPAAVPAGWPVLDPAARHGLAGEIVSGIEPHSEADPAGLLVSVLVAFGALVGAGPHAVADSAPHPARLNAVLVGNTAKGRKGSAQANVDRLMRAADPYFARERCLNGYGSGEALIDALRPLGEGEVADHRLLVTEPEFARILGVARRDGSTLSAVIRQAWDGGRLAVRSRSGTTVADNAHVCVLAHISADELRAKLTETDVAGGFANRFLFVCVRRSKLLASGGNLDDGTGAGFARNFALLATKARKVGTLRRTPEATSYWEQIYAEMAADEPAGLLAAIIARDSAQVLRLSVTYALLDGGDKIGAEHVRAAWALWQYCRASAAFVFGESVGHPLADALLRAVRDAGPAGLDGRAQYLVLGGHASKGQLEAARELLVAKGLVAIETVATGGRPSTVLKATDCEQSEQSEQSPFPQLSERELSP